MSVLSAMRALSIVLTASGWLVVLRQIAPPLSIRRSRAWRPVPLISGRGDLGVYTLTLAAASECGNGLGGVQTT